MSNEKYICHLCGSQMYWTGYVSQDLNNKHYCDVLYQYRCGNHDCRYESKYKRLDSAGIRVKNMIDAEAMRHFRDERRV